MLVEHPIFWILVAAVTAPLLAETPLGFKVPVVVLEVVLGIVIGPHVLGLVHFGGSVPTEGLLGITVVGLLHAIPQVAAPLMVTVALCTTGLGVLVPVFRDGGQLETAFGRLFTNNSDRGATFDFTIPVASA